MVDLVPQRQRTIPLEVKRAVIARDGLVCQICRDDLAGKTLHLDHIVHWASGGPNTVENLRVTCAPCNLNREKPLEIVRRVARSDDDAGDYVRLTPAARRRLQRLRDKEAGIVRRLSDDPEIARILARPATARQARITRQRGW